MKTTYKPVPINRLPAAEAARPTLRLRISTVFGLVFLAALLSPTVSFLGHGFVLAWGIFPLWAVSVVIESPSAWGRLRSTLAARKWQLIWLFLWMAVIATNMLMGRGVTGRVHLILMINVVLLVGMEILITATGSENWRALVLASALLLGLEVLRSLPVLWSDPGLAKKIMYYGGGSEIYAQALTSGVGEYNFYTALAVALPVLFILLLNNRGFLRFASLVTLAAFGLAIVLSTFMGAILLLFAGGGGLVVLSLLLSRQRGRIFAGVVMLVFFAAGLWYFLLRSSMQWENFSTRLTAQVEGVVSSGLVEGDTTNRSDLWKASWKTFQRNPLWGFGPVTGTKNQYMGFVVGGHSSILDLPAEYGLVGAGCYLIFLYLSMRRVYDNLRRNPLDLLAQARLVACGLFLLGGSYNPTFFVPQINVAIFFFAMGGIQPVKETPVETIHLQVPGPAHTPFGRQAHLR